ncbi:MAG TPA: hypothetical protein VLE69_03450 [Candidatus Saccharimonadales bacterium]|nr:hypothetical protein [Candidatus Saccharimonadales bacterium]
MRYRVLGEVAGLGMMFIGFAGIGTAAIDAYNADKEVTKDEAVVYALGWSYQPKENIDTWEANKAADEQVRDDNLSEMGGFAGLTALGGCLFLSTVIGAELYDDLMARKVKVIPLEVIPAEELNNQ